MSVSPMEYLKKEYFEPLNLTQEELSIRLNLGTRTINELLKNKRKLNLETATKFAKFLNESPMKLLQMQLEYDLNNKEVDTSDIVPLKVDKLYFDLLNSLNNYCEEYSETYKLSDLYEVFKNNNFKKYKKLVKLLFDEVPLAYTVKYMLKNSVGLTHLKKLYHFYLKELDGKPYKQFESLFLDNEKQVVEKFCNNEKYFDTSREFEKYLYTRLVFFKHKEFFLEKATETNNLEVKQRALYLYFLLSPEKYEKPSFDVKVTSFYGKTKVKPYLEPNEFGLVNTLDQNRFNQFKTMGVF